MKSLWTGKLFSDSLPGVISFWHKNKSISPKSKNSLQQDQDVEILMNHSITITGNWLILIYLQIEQSWWSLVLVVLYTCHIWTFDTNNLDGNNGWRFKLDAPAATWRQKDFEIFAAAGSYNMPVIKKIFVWNYFTEFKDFLACSFKIFNRKMGENWPLDYQHMIGEWGRMRDASKKLSFFFLDDFWTRQYSSGIPCSCHHFVNLLVDRSINHKLTLVYYEF